MSPSWDGSRAMFSRLAWESGAMGGDRTLDTYTWSQLRDLKAHVAGETTQTQGQSRWVWQSKMLLHRVPVAVSADKS